MMQTDRQPAMRHAERGYLANVFFSQDIITYMHVTSIKTCF